MPVFRTTLENNYLSPYQKSGDGKVDTTHILKGTVKMDALSCLKPGNGTGLLASIKWISILFLLLLISCDGMNRSEVFKIKDPQKATQKLLQISGFPSAELVEIQHLIEHGADVNAVHESNGRTPLHLASENGCLQTVAALLKANANVNAKGFLDYTPLHVAVYYGQTDVVSILVDAGANVNAVNDKDETPLFFAAMSGNVQIARLLIEANADVEAASIDYGEAPIHQAASRGHTQIITLLLEANANVNAVAVANGGITALHRAIIQGEIGSVKTLLNGNADVNAVDSGGRTPLYDAAWRHIEIVNLLLNAGAQVNIAERKSGETPLHSAVLHDKLNIVEALLSAGADVNAKDKWGSTPLHFAASPGTATALLKAKAKVNAVNSGGRIPLHDAAHRGMDQVVQTLLGAGADVNRNIDGTPLFLAANNGYAQTVDALIEAGADVNATDKGGTTPLLVASSNGHGTIVAALLEAGADANVEAVADGNIITTALRIAKDKHYNDIVELLKIHAKNKSGKAFLQAAATLRLKDLIKNLNANDSEKLTRLLKEGADANMRNQFGETLLCAAARAGYSQMVDSLIAANADVNAGCTAFFRNTPHLNGDESLAELLSALAEVTNNLAHPTVIENFTPLHWSASNGDKQIVAALLKARADANAKAYYGKVVCTPLIVAEKNGHIDIVELLKSHGVQNM
jgi:cytohesin